MVIVLRARVARSANNERKLCTGRPSGVSPVVCLAMAAGEGCACDYAFPQGFGRLPIGVIEQHWRQMRAHMPFEVIDPMRVFGGQETYPPESLTQNITRIERDNEHTQSLLRQPGWKPVI